MTIDTMIYGYMVDEHSYSDKQAIIEENSLGDWVYVVLEGQVRVKKQTKKGTVTLATLDEGAVFGEMPLFVKTSKVRMATVEAHEPVRVGVLDTARLDRELESLSPQLRRLLRTLGARFTDTVERISRVAAEQ